MQYVVQERPGYDVETDGYFAHLKRKMDRKRAGPLLCDLDKLVDCILSDKDGVLYGAVSTYVGLDAAGHELHVLVMDCDGEDEMLAAAHWTKTILKFNYVVVASSPQRYWIVTDFVGSIKDIVHHMERTPGVDSKFIKFIEKNQRIFIRALPKMDYETKSISVPSFPENTLVHPKTKEWLDDFAAYWNGPELEMMKKSIELRAAIKWKIVGQIAQRPSFEL